ncbi:UBC-like protein [Saitoella complicata NRRL Y-17804]|uniref:UBC-like protein n=1 Tax=Saitoella complicata (strain BCRC 22490 / CBS 7301 / JCM 7358 / NBRC 10748 / NRRL Y-17804) TaxID=698492 RepID=UPI000867C45C|nr:UBC-like protein [Saitoella complicata NRRL Y-17804]ODQ55480.1 UBC-like protein [Saitoella complicata NRRL Y-17804]
MALAQRRIQKELKNLAENPPAGISLKKADDLKTWHVNIATDPDGIYGGQVFEVIAKFPSSYPIEAPEITFAAPVPVHPHIYSNGHICLDILYQAYSPVLTISAICISLQSMLASCKKLERPPDNDSYVRRAGLSPKGTRFMFHDDTV